MNSPLLFSSMLVALWQYACCSVTATADIPVVGCRHVSCCEGVKLISVKLSALVWLCCFGCQFWGEGELSHPVANVSACIGLCKKYSAVIHVVRRFSLSISLRFCLLKCEISALCIATSSLHCSFWRYPSLQTCLSTFSSCISSLLFNSCLLRLFPRPHISLIFLSIHICPSSSRIHMIYLGPILLIFRHYGSFFCGFACAEQEHAGGNSLIAPP